MILKINKEFQSLIPPLSIEEYQQLEKNIIADGCREPLVVWQGTIVDGHNRYKICAEHNIPFNIVEKQFKDSPEVIEWMLRNQLGRRNLTDFQRNEVALRYQSVIAEQMKKNSLKNLKQNIPSGSPDHIGEPTNQRTELAKIAKTSEGSIYRSKQILDKGTPEQIERARKGGKGNSVNAVYKEVTQKSEEDTKVCTKCGQTLHVSNFYKGKNACKSCLQSQRPIKDFLGNTRKITDEYIKNLTEEEVIGDLYNADKIINRTIEDAIEEFEVNFKTSLRMLDDILEDYKNLLEDQENNKKMMAVLSEAVAAMSKMKGKYLYEKL